MDLREVKTMNGTKNIRLKALGDDMMEQVSGGAYNGAVFMYTLQPGDKLSVLAHRFGTTVRVLRELNNLTDDPDQLRPGRTIMIPQR
jgi:nucleoid-associated protein YgaU